VRVHHRQSLLHASMEGVAYLLTHTTIEGGKAASKRVARLPPSLGSRERRRLPSQHFAGQCAPWSWHPRPSATR
jgi:hypothetical protein